MSEDNRYCVRLIDGNLYDVWNPSGPVPSPETVAHGLANLCRYGGHVVRPYTVCEHTIWCAMALACGGHDTAAFEMSANRLAADQNDWLLFAFDGISPERRNLALLALVHDAPEGCGLVDVPGPILRHEEMHEYKEAHLRCMAWLYGGWNISTSVKEELAVKEVDRNILGAELAIRPKFADEKTGSGETLPPWPRLDLINRHDLSFMQWRIRRAWIAAFHALKERV